MLLRLINTVRTRLRGLLRREAVLRAVDDELRFHLDMEAQANVSKGMTPAEARLAALRSFGDVGRVRDAAHEIRGGGLLETVWQDVRFGARTLRKRPGFTLIAAPP